jgi:hypothetical protein
MIHKTIISNKLILKSKSGFVAGAYGGLQLDFFVKKKILG